MQRPKTPPVAQAEPISLLLMAAVVVHLPLLLMKLPLKSFDTNFHIFFASHYVHHWFDPWNAKWYAGFSQTTYPPLPQQWVALVSHVVGLDMAYMAVQLAAILLLVLGVYRFSLLWVSPRAAWIAALASIFLGAESFLVYSAGQLGTTCAAPIYLNALPFLYEWVRFGRWRAFLKAIVLFAAAAAAHHATLLFGSVLFAVPVLALAVLDREDENGARSTMQALAVRTLLIVVLVGAVIAVPSPSPVIQSKSVRSGGVWLDTNKINAKSAPAASGPASTAKATNLTRYLPSVKRGSCVDFRRRSSTPTRTSIMFSAL